MDDDLYPAPACRLHDGEISPPRNILLIEIFQYYISFRECKLWYLYVRKTHGWYQEEFITIKVVRKLLGILILLVFLPLLKKFKFSDINLLIAFNFLHGVGFLLGSLSIYSTGFLIAGQYLSYITHY